MKFCFGDIVIVDNVQIGVVLKCWCGNRIENNYDVYVRSYNEILNYKESEIQRYMVRHKYLNKEEMQYQHNAINGC